MHKGIVYYVSKIAAGLNDGTSWENAWNELDRISWSIIQPRDTILIDGGSISLTYTTALIIGKSGTSEAPIIIRLASEAGKDGQAILFGGRSTPLPYDGQYPPDYVLPAANLHSVDFNGYEHIVVDGIKCRGFDIHGNNSSGVLMTGNHNRVRYAEIYDNGDWGPGQDDESIGSPGCPGIHVGGSHQTVGYCIIHDNGEDGIQHYGRDNRALTYFTLNRSWIYNKRMDPLHDAAFNHEKHNDCFQIWNWNAPECHHLYFNDSILGPGISSIAVIGDSSETMSIVKDVHFKNCLAFGDGGSGQGEGITSSYISLGRRPPCSFPDNWTMDHCTVVRRYIGEENEDPGGTIEFGGRTGVSVTNSVIVGGGGALFFECVPYTENNIYFSFRYPIGVMGNKAIGREIDPVFRNNGALYGVGDPRGYLDFDFTITSNDPGIPAGVGTSITSLDKLLGSLFNKR